MTKQLHDILQQRFGFESFRPHQEEACTAVANGADVLLVMPTGAGKSLCYQIPGLAREGVTLVISPLVALIEDQVAALQARGLRAERIHSGRNRDDSRQACVQYLNGTLDFLFIAPERLAVPGFLEMLAKRKPALIAIDEAHCISQWGHDFRPEYRMLGQRLPALRPAPIMALTATATARVQDDICAGLGMPQARRLIHGFRRKNIAIEVAEMNPGERLSTIMTVLTPNERRPAIIYAPTRKKADETSESLSKYFNVAAYHAGLSATQRDKVQTAFQCGDTDVIVATIAFGMGIDKSNVRTVAHLALPASVEAYYQEIGRAGRDGAPCKAILLHSFIDRKTHDFFRERDYPESHVLSSIFEAATTTPQDPEVLKASSGLKEDEFQRALEKLWIHQGVLIDTDQNIQRGDANWVKGYTAQRTHRIRQLEDVARYAEGDGCRMTALVRYFGDKGDSGTDCGICDWCAPLAATTTQSRMRPFNDHENTIAHWVLTALSKGASDGNSSPSTGKLARDCAEACGAAATDRRLFERVLSALTKAQLLSFYEDSFEKDGTTIRFRRVFLKKNADTTTLAAARIADEPSKKSGLKKKKRPTQVTSLDQNNISPNIVAALKTWRLGVARSEKVPAFRILSDKVLTAIAAAQPADTDALMEVHGMGPRLCAKFGKDILGILRS